MGRRWITSDKDGNVNGICSSAPAKTKLTKQSRYPLELCKLPFRLPCSMSYKQADSRRVTRDLLLAPAGMMMMTTMTMKTRIQGGGEKSCTPAAKGGESPPLYSCSG